MQSRPRSQPRRSSARLPLRASHAQPREARAKGRRLTAPPPDLPSSTHPANPSEAATDAEPPSSESLARVVDGLSHCLPPTRRRLPPLVLSTTPTLTKNLPPIPSRHPYSTTHIIMTTAQRIREIEDEMGRTQKNKVCGEVLRSNSGGRCCPSSAMTLTSCPRAPPPPRPRRPSLIPVGCRMPPIIQTG
jgi:hypothetical protein